MNKQKIKNYTWNTLGTGFNSIISLFFLIIITRINGVEIAGKFSLCYSVSLIIYVILLFGNRNYQATDKNEFSDNEYLSSKILSILLGVITTVIWCLFFKYGLEKSLLLIILVLYKSIDAISESIYAIFQKNNRLDYVGISYFIKSSFILIIFLIVNIITKNILYSSIGVLIADLIIFILYDLRKVYKFYDLKLKFCYTKSKNILNATKYIFLFSLLMILMINIPRLFTDYFLSDYDLGYYSIIIMFPTIFSLLGQFIIQPELVNYSNLYYQKKYDELNKLITKTTINIGVISGLIFIIFYLFGTSLLELLYNIEFTNFKIIIMFSLASGIFNIYCQYYSALLTVYRKTKEQFGLYIFTCIIELILCYLLIINYKLIGIFAAYLLTMFVQLICFIILFVIENKKIRK